MDHAIATCLEKFFPISLEALNGKAEMLERVDNKYIMPVGQLLPALDALKDFFDVLDIEGQRAFSYATRYFDDAEQRSYYDHHQRRRKRVKARVRQYLDAGFSYLEVKVNEQRAMTAKRRMRISSPLRSLDDQCMDFVRTCYCDCYGDEFCKELEPVILIEYQRITLVAKEGGERLTIDTGMMFNGPKASRAADQSIFIIETKSARGNGIADKIFRAQHATVTKRVSKFCIGMAVTGQVVRYNGYLPAMRKLGFVGSGSSAFSQLCSEASDTLPRNSSHEIAHLTHVDPFASRPALAGQCI